MLEGRVGCVIWIMDKHQKSNQSNSRNGFSKRRYVLLSWGSEIAVAKGQGCFFKSMIVAKRGKHGHGSRNVIRTLYAKGMQQQRYRGANNRGGHNFDVSTSTIFPKDYGQGMGDIYVASGRTAPWNLSSLCWMDGIVFKVREAPRSSTRRLLLP